MTVFRLNQRQRITLERLHHQMTINIQIINDENRGRAQLQLGGIFRLSGCTSLIGQRLPHPHFRKNYGEDRTYPHLAFYLNGALHHFHQ